MWNRSNDYAFRWKVDPLVVNVAAVCHASIPRDVIEISVARLGFCIRCFTLNIFFFRVQGNSGCWGVVLTWIKKFEKKQNVYLIWQLFLFFLRSLSLSSLDKCPINGPCFKLKFLSPASRMRGSISVRMFTIFCVRFETCEIYKNKSYKTINFKFLDFFCCIRKIRNKL